MEKTFQLSVVTPERVVLEREAVFVAFPAYDGEVGVLTQRAPLLARLGHGLLRVEGGAGGDEAWFVSGGFAQMVDNHLTLLTDEARRPADFDRSQLEAELAASQALPAADEPSRLTRDKALARGRAKLRLLR